MAVTPIGAMGAAWTQPSCSTSPRWRQSAASAATSHSGAPNGQSTAEEFWEEEHKKPANRVYGPPAPGRRNQGIPVASIFDLALLPKNVGGKASGMSSVCQEEERRTEAVNSKKRQFNNKNEISIATWRWVDVDGRRGAPAEIRNE